MGVTWVILVLASLAMGQNIWAFYLEDNRSVPLFSPLSRAVDLYNTEQGNEWAFNLLDIIPSSSRPHSRNPRVVHFTIKETYCEGSVRKRLRKCSFKDGGLVKICSLTVFEDQNIVTVPVCDDVPEQLQQFNSESSKEESGSRQMIKDAKNRRKRPGSYSFIGRINRE
ncbi:cathelicidin-related peptide Pt_CRAMP2 [Xenopus laevis]|uniref:Uncharacterized protein n=2 Tax=Xenopus laevis TaxID=8355 RepID=A0A974CNB1_XENLA|nr:cathelicidin-related peptide Pt_CRAMP2 [Xenopus laevis]OCT75371.1 hypothetical protein XELAEV_18030550mg [Xenopus laevis]